MTIEWIPTKASRKITAKEQGNRGFFTSDKIKGGIVEYESCLERDLLLECNHAPDFELELKMIIDEYIFDKKDLTIKKVFEMCLERANKAELPKGSITYSLIRRKIISE